ncbi:MAG: N-acetyltransferase [Thermodesulfobacteriota bacterium]
MITIRKERTEDIPHIRDINLQAFGQPAEARIIEALRRNCAAFLSLVAEDDGQLIGHILFTPVVIDPDGRGLAGMGLAPMAVLPERQRQGTGSALVERGLQLLRQRACPFVVVLGHPQFYARFGFTPASRRNIRSQWQAVPDEAFGLLVLDQAAMQGISGTACYRDEFNEAMQPALFSSGPAAANLQL